MKFKNPNFYYLIGLICADGHIQWPKCTKSITDYSCIIGLKYDDRDILDKMQKRFKGKIYIYTHKNKQTYCKWRLTDKRFILYLRDIVGLTNNKSLTLNVRKWFNSLNLIQKEYFIHGVFDGDGWVYVGKYNNPNIGICSASCEFINMLFQHIKLGRIKEASGKNGNIYYSWIIDGYDILLFKNILLSKTNFFLKRKRKLYRQIYNFYRKRYQKFPKKYRGENREAIQYTI